jgi:phospholipid-binding lipoprotein MlaA
MPTGYVSLASGPETPRHAETTHCNIRPIMRCAVVLTSAPCLVGCAHVPTNPEALAEYRDSVEPTNRGFFAGNQFVDRQVLQLVAHGYEDLPGRARGSLHNFVSNLGQPAVAVNDLLQANIRRAWNTTQRFSIDTHSGGVGSVDVATD